MPLSKQQVKDNIDQDIRLKTSANSISPENVGKNMKDIVDLIPDAIQGPDGLSAYQVAVNNGFIGTEQDWLNSLVGPQGPPGSGSGASLSYLPIPQIAKRKIKIPDGKIPLGNDRKRLDGITNRMFSISDLTTITFAEEYYKEQFDIYFNSFGDMDWLNLPDKKIELCMVSNKSYKTSGPGILNLSGKGNKDNFTNAIVHPANSGYNINTINNTNYSGGTAWGASNGPNLFPGIKQTEWILDETSLSFGDNINGSGLNRLNNPNITVEIDVRDFFQIKGRVNTSEELLTYPMILDNSEGYIRVKKIGDIKPNNNSGRVYKRNSVLFFRLSAGIPESYDSVNERYNKRLFSDLSQPIYICPKIANFYNNLGDYSQGYKTYIFGHTTKIGSK